MTKTKTKNHLGMHRLQADLQVDSEEHEAAAEVDSTARMDHLATMCLRRLGLLFLQSLPPRLQLHHVDGRVQVSYLRPISRANSKP